MLQQALRLGAPQRELRGGHALPAPRQRVEVQHAHLPRVVSLALIPSHDPAGGRKLALESLRHQSIITHSMRSDFNASCPVPENAELYCDSPKFYRVIIFPTNLEFSGHEDAKRVIM